MVFLHIIGHMRYLKLARRRITNGLSMVILIFLIIEFVDELVFGVNETAWPLIRDDLGLTYTQIGLALSLPGLVGLLVEPVLGILGDTWRRRVLILGGGVVFSAALFMISGSASFATLLIASALFYPASGAFVSLSQASLMDAQPERREQNMARWTFAGSLGVTAGPLALSAAAAFGLGWRGLFAVLGGISLAALLLAWRIVPERASMPEGEQRAPLAFFDGLKNAWQALRRPSVLRWLMLLEFSDLMLDVLYSYLALYLVDVAGLRPEAAALGVAVWTGFGLLGDFLLIPLLERVRGLDYLRVSVLLELILFPAFLLVQPVAAKFAILGLLGFFNSGWYSVLMGRLYSEMPGQSATVMTLGNFTGFFGKLIPLGIGLAAQQFGLEWAMWVLLAGPLALMVGLPRRTAPAEQVR